MAPNRIECKPPVIDGPHLLTDPVRKAGPLTYICSGFGREFLLPEKSSRGEAIAELWAGFNEHAAKVHGEGPDSLASPGFGEGAIAYNPRSGN